MDGGNNTKFSAGVFVLLRDRRSGMKLELNWYPEGTKHNTPYTTGEGLDHIAFRVNNLKEEFKQLLEKGATPADFTPDASGGVYDYLKDPDGNWIELYQSREPIGEDSPKGYQRALRVQFPSCFPLAYPRQSMIDVSNCPKHLT